MNQTGVASTGSRRQAFRNRELCTGLFADRDVEELAREGDELFEPERLVAQLGAQRLDFGSLRFVEVVVPGHDRDRRIRQARDLANGAQELEAAGQRHPQIEKPIESPEDIDRLKIFEPRESLSHVLEAIGLIQGELAGRLPLIGFGGAPFTLASYAIEGGHSNNFARTKSLMYGHPEAWHRLCDTFATVIGDYMVAQIDAGVDAVQIFDSWVGTLSSADYREFALPHTQKIFQAIGGRVPTIHFGTGTATILEDLREAGGDVIGVDWRSPIDTAWDRIGHDHAVQGNLDPTLLLGPTARMFSQTDDILARVGGRPGHIFNLGHGILPSTPVEHVQMLAQYVHSASRRNAT